MPKNRGLEKKSFRKKNSLKILEVKQKLYYICTSKNDTTWRYP